MAISLGIYPTFQTNPYGFWTIWIPTVPSHSFMPSTMAWASRQLMRRCGDAVARAVDPTTRASWRGGWNSGIVFFQNQAGFLQDPSTKKNTWSILKSFIFIGPRRNKRVAQPWCISFSMAEAQRSGRNFQDQNTRLQLWLLTGFITNGLHQKASRHPGPLQPAFMVSEGVIVIFDAGHMIVWLRILKGRTGKKTG